MRRRIRSLLSLPLPAVYTVEAALIGLFWIQALRFLIGNLYARIASASLYPALNPNLIDPTLPGLVDPSTVNNELSLLVYILILPLITLIAGRFRWLFILAAAITAVGRYLMVDDSGVSSTVAATIVLGGGLLYIALIIRHRVQVFPYMFIFALSTDQLLRAFGNTLDPSWSSNYTSSQLMLSIITLLLALFTVIREGARHDDNAASSDVGLFTFWSGLGFGAVLYLELSFLGLPNAVAGRADISYTLVVPLLLMVTMLSLVPWIRGRARWFISLFDSNVRGWSWMLLIILLIVLGIRLSGIIAGAALIFAQFLSMMLWWWFARPKAQKERSFTGLWLVIGILVFAIFVVFDIFTYEYAFVRDFAPGASLFNGLIPLDFLNEIIPPLLRGFRGLGLAVILLSVFMMMLPMIQSRRRIAWSGGNPGVSIFMLVLMAGFGVLASYAARPPVVQAVVEPEIRVGTYNIHAGYNEFFYYDLEAIARTIQQSGANVVLIQEIEAGRLTSFGVDQPLWLARRLGMDRRFFPTNEGLQGLAVLSNIEIVFDDGYLLDSFGSQTGLQRVQIRPDAGVITIYNTWLDPLLDIGTSMSTDVLESSQLAQLTQIFQIISTHRTQDGQLGRTIFGGTFNNVPDSDLIRRVQNNGFIDHFAGGTVESTATFWRTGERARLDYLWTARLTVVERGVSDSNASDHRIATIKVQIR